MKTLHFTVLLLLMLSNHFLYAQDWANTERFRQENEMFKVSQNKQNRIVLMGNSITEDWSKFSPEFFLGKPYINRGISGQTTPKMLFRFRADVINLKPALVVILAGTNDIAQNTGFSTLPMIMDNIISMAELAKANKIKVVLSSVLPAFDYPWKPGLEPAQKIEDLNNMIKEYALANKIIYLDYYSSMVDERKGLKKEFTYDGVHPNKAGYLHMEPLLEAAIKKALK